MARYFGWFFGLWTFLFAPVTWADAQNRYDIILAENPPGGEFAVGQVLIREDGSYELSWDETMFSENFLSMRPFRCLDGPEKQWCRVPYPYENRRNLVEGDLTDLEYDLLFIWKDKGDYGIDMWNGVYYRLLPTPDGLGGLIHEMDMDILSAPPDDGSLRPIRDVDIEPGDKDSHWLPYIYLNLIE